MGAKSRTIYIILGMLSIEPMSGYDIRKAIKDSTSFFWSESDGQLYPALAKCVELGYTTFEEVPSDKKLKAKKIYTITEQGAIALKEWLTTEAQPKTQRSEFLLKIFFGANVAIEENIQHLRNKQRELKQKQLFLKRYHQDLKQKNGESKDTIYWLLTLDYGIHQIESSLAWCNNAIKKLEELNHA